MPGKLSFPTRRQLIPSPDKYAAIWLLARVRRTHNGAMPAPPLVCTDDDPAAVRR